MCSIISSGILKVSIVCVCGEREGGGGRERESIYTKSFSPGKAGVVQRKMPVLKY